MKYNAPTRIANLVCTAIVVGALAFMMPVSARAEMLVYVITDSSGTELFLDVESIKIQGNQVTAWEELDHKKDNTIKHRKSKIRTIYYCSSEQTAIVNIIHYDASDRAVFSWQVKDFQFEKLAVVPGTVGEEMYQKACASLSQ
jgi:hypothetical protein